MLCDIINYEPKGIQEQKDKELILSFNDLDELKDRLFTPAHLTSSAFIMNEELSKVLFVYHNIYKSWSWTGGHCDGDDDFLRVAIREGTEETGVKKLTPLTGDIDSLEVLHVLSHFKRREYVSTHLHLNVTYILIASESEELQIKPDENSGVKWIDINRLDDYVSEKDMLPIYDKLIKVARAGSLKHKERMLAGLAYKADQEGLKDERLDCFSKTFAFNHLNPKSTVEKLMILKDILKDCCDDIEINAPFNCDYGKNIMIGSKFFANYNLTILDVAPVVIGNNVLLGPNVSLFTAGHPIHFDARNAAYEYGKPITIKDNVWIGGNVVVLPGVSIGKNVVIGAGSVVTKDIADNMVAYGNPCKVMRAITDEDKKYYYKKEVFDIDYTKEDKALVCRNT